MHPWLLYTGPLRLPTYFTLLMIGFALGTFVLRREALRDRIPVRDVMDAALWMLPSALVGARLVHVVVEAPGYYAQHPLDALSPLAGWVFYGGALGGILAVVAHARYRGHDPWRLLDHFTLATALGLVFGRLGCLGGGCCFGRVADWPLGVAVPWAIRYYRRGQLPEELVAVPLHPAPLYEIGLVLVLFVALSRLRERQRFAGQIFLAFLATYGVGRSLIEVFRADVERGLFLGGWLSTSQIIGIATALAVAIVWRDRATRCIPSSST